MIVRVEVTPKLLEDTLCLALQAEHGDPDGSPGPRDVRIVSSDRVPATSEGIVIVLPPPGPSGASGHLLRGGTDEAVTVDTVEQLQALIDRLSAEV